MYFHQGDIEKGHCNQGWVMFENFVLVIDGNYPSGAEIVVSKIRAMTDKPIRFAFDTHHHGDHMYGNKVWMDAGAIPVAHEGVIEGGLSATSPSDGRARRGKMLSRASSFCRSSAFPTSSFSMTGPGGSSFFISA